MWRWEDPSIFEVQSDIPYQSAVDVPLHLREYFVAG
jgi:hypothetical protein